MHSRKIDQYLSYIQNAFSGCADFNSRAIQLGHEKLGYLFNIGSYTDRDYISEGIVLPLLRLGRCPRDKDEVFGIITCTELVLLTDSESAVSKLLSGFAVILLETDDGVYIYSCQVRMVASRSISEPESETVIRGPREGFVESSEDNLALLRKRLKTKDFKSTRLTCGNYTDTTVYICYLSGAVNHGTLARVKKQIESLDIPAIIDSGYIEQYLQKKSPSLFTNVGNSEKPDVVAAKMLEGRIAVICDGSPVVLTIPYLFIESLQSAEDYLKTPYYSTFMRILRLLSAAISLYLPSVYLSTVEHHTSALPYQLYKAVIKLRSDVPFGVFGELLTILIIFELIREAGVRMPKAVGSAASIVAGLVLGDAAISANLASAPVIIVASLTAVCTFITPPFMNSMVLIRFINLLSAQLLGFPGVILSILFLLACLTRKESFGVPYFLPFSPLKPKSLYDSIIAVPKKAIESTDTSLYEKEDEN